MIQEQGLSSPFPGPEKAGEATGQQEAPRAWATLLALPIPGSLCVTSSVKLEVCVPGEQGVTHLAHMGA
jgi:hypothetical protein